jgi:thioesterase domain-containing protein
MCTAVVGTVLIVGAGLGVLGLFGWRRKRKTAAAIELAIFEAVATITTAQSAKPYAIGHSLGGTLAANAPAIGKSALIG